LCFGAMLSKILKPIENELLLVESIIAQNLFTRAGNIDKFIRLKNISYTSRVIRPALTILPARLFGCKDDKVLVLASIFQFIYMALKVQQNVAEEGRDLTAEQDNSKDGFQFPVLVGDYLYGKFFYFLSRAGLLSFLEPLAELIYSLHEGSLMEKNIGGKNIPSYTVYEAVRKETAEIFAGCCRLGARMAGASPADQHYLGCYGQNFGMAFGLLERRYNADKIAFYLNQAVKSLYFVPEKEEKRILEQIVRVFLNRAKRSAACTAT